ncbi:hypothetical protein BDV18DRAFT_135155 [Aspergillus unguis]
MPCHGMVYLTSFEPNRFRIRTRQARAWLGVSAFVVIFIVRSMDCLSIVLRRLAYYSGWCFRRAQACYGHLALHGHQALSIHSRILPYFMSATSIAPAAQVPLTTYAGTISDTESPLLCSFAAFAGVSGRFKAQASLLQVSELATTIWTNPDGKRTNLEPFQWTYSRARNCIPFCHLLLYTSIP